MNKIKPIIVGGIVLALVVKSVFLSTVDVFAMEITSSTTISSDLVEDILVSTSLDGAEDKITITIEDGVNVSGNISIGNVYVAEKDSVTIINYGTIAGNVTLKEGVSFVNYGTVTKLNTTDGEATLYGGYIDELLVDSFGTLQVEGDTMIATASFNDNSVTTGNGSVLYVSAGLNMNGIQSDEVPIVVEAETYITSGMEVVVSKEGCGNFYIPQGTVTAKFCELFSCEISGAGLDANMGMMIGDSSMTGGNYTVFTNTGILPLTLIAKDLESDYYDFTIEYASGVMVQPSESAKIQFKNKKGLSSGSYTDAIEFTLAGFKYTLTVSHEFIETSGNSFIFNGTVGENDFYTSDVTISAGEGFSIAYAQSTDFVKSLTFSDGEYEIFLDAKHDATGTLLEQNQRYAFTIDTKAPVIKGVENGKEYYTDAHELTVSDAYLGAVTINSEPIGMVDDTLVLSSNQGVEVYEVVAKDMAGNKTSVKITVLD